MKPDPASVSRAAQEAAAWFFENSDDVFVVIHDNLVEQLNPGWRLLTGWTHGETIGRPFWEFVPQADHPLLLKAIEDLGVAGSVVYEHRIQCADGVARWMRSRVKRAEGGRALVVLQDITEEKSRAKRREQTSRMGELLRMTSGVSLWIYDPEMDVFDLDPSTAADRGPEDPSFRVPGHLYRDAIHPDDRQAVDAAWEETLAAGVAHNIEYRNRFEGGEWRRIRTAWMGAGQSGDGRWMISGLTHDVTDLVTARDAALAAADAKSRFLANISHELHTPMNGVLGMLHLLKTAPRAADRERMVDQALSSGAALAQLLNDLVTFAELEAGDARLAPEPTDVGALLAAVMDLVRDDARGKGLDLDLAVQADIAWRMADAARLRQVMFNLVGNAVKFTASGAVRVSAMPAGEADRIRIVVTDTGVGIPEDAQGTLFERFEQGDGSSTRRFGGSGLGLAIARRVAQLMDGEVGFTSLPGRGSEFWIELAAPVCEPLAADAGDGALWLRGLKILVVEDNPTNRIVATRMLTQLGAQVHTADNGLEGVEAASSTAFDLIFMDIQMPVMDGVEATHRIRALPGAAARTPIVALTANVLKDQIAAYHAAGMNGFLAKPLSPASLMSELTRLANDDQPAAALRA